MVKILVKAVYAGSVETLGTLGDLKLDLLSLLECSIAIHVDGRKMDENIIFFFVGLYEPISLGIIKPFYSTGHHRCYSSRRWVGVFPLLVFQAWIWLPLAPCPEHYIAPLAVGKMLTYPSVQANAWARQAPVGRSDLHGQPS